MGEQHESYRVWGATTDIIVNQLNQIFNLLSNRLDQIEGLRGTPTVYDDTINYPNKNLSGFLKGSATSASYDNVSFDDLTGSLLSLESGYLKIEDANGTVIHQIGDAA